MTSRRKRMKHAQWREHLEAQMYSPEGSWVPELYAGFDVGTLQRFLAAVGR